MLRKEEHGNTEEQGIWGGPGEKKGMPGLLHYPQPTPPPPLLPCLLNAWSFPDSYSLVAASLCSTCSSYHNPTPALPALRPQSGSPGSQGPAQSR